MANIYGLNNHNMKKYLRIHGTENWRKECLRKANYKCSVTGKKASKGYPLDVHHNGVSFHEIMMEAHKSLGIKYHKYIMDYKPEEVQALVDKLIEMHKDIEGVVIRHDFHMSLHDKYGTYPTKDDYKAFKKEYRTRLYKVKNSSYRKTA